MRQVLAIETESAETIEADGGVLMGDNPGPLSSRGIGPAVAAHCPPLAVGSGSGASGSATGLGGLSLSSLMGASPTPRAVSIAFGAFRRTRFVFVLGAIVRTGGQIFVSPLKFAISRSSFDAKLRDGERSARRGAAHPRRGRRSSGALSAVLIFA